MCIFIEGKIKAIQLVNARVIVQTVLLPFYFLNTLQSDINSNRVYVLGHKYVFGPSQTHFTDEKNKSAEPIATVPKKDIFLVLPGVCLFQGPITWRISARQTGLKFQPGF